MWTIIGWTVAVIIYVLGMVLFFCAEVAYQSWDRAWGMPPLPLWAIGLRAMIWPLVMILIAWEALQFLWDKESKS